MKLKIVWLSFFQITEDLTPNYTFVEQSLLELPISNELYQDLTEGQKFCKEANQCQPSRPQLYDLPITKELRSSLEYYRCFGKEKMRACLKTNIAAMTQLIDDGTLTGTPFNTKDSSFRVAMEDLEGLLNGVPGQFVDLLLL